MAVLPYWARNLPAGPSGYGRMLEFDSPLDIEELDLTAVDDTGIAATAAIADELGGVLLLTNGAADNDSWEAQWRAETIDLNALGKTVWIFGRFKLSEATQSDFFFGAAIRDTTFIAGVSDGYFFRKDNGDTNTDIVIAKDASTFPDDYTQTNAVATMDTDWHEYAIRVQTDATTLGTATFTYYVDGTPVGGAIQTTSAPCDEVLALSFGLQNGSAASRNLRCDYIGVWYPDAR